MGIEISAAPTYAPYTVGPARIRVINRSKQPIMIDWITASLASGSRVLSARGSKDFKARKAADGKLSIAMKYVVYQSGPPELRERRRGWMAEGSNVRLYLVDVLGPGEVRTFDTEIVPTDAPGEAIKVSLGYADLKAAAHYTVAKAEGSDTGGEPTDLHGVPYHLLATRTLHLVLTRDSPRGGTTIQWPRTPPLEPSAEISQLRFIPEGDLASRRRKAIVAETPLSVQSPAFTLAQARAKAGVPTGPSAHIVGDDVWVLRGDGVTWLVGANRLIRVAGDAVPLASDLVTDGHRKVTLYVKAARRDPRGEEAALASLGIAVRVDVWEGAWSAKALITRATLVRFLEFLDKRRLRIDGDSVSPL